MATTDDLTGARHSALSGAAAALPGRRIPRRVRRFLDTEAAGGIILLAAAVVALVWANSPWRDSYRTLWSTELTIGLGRYVLAEDLQHWVNDALMAIFFFVVGLEIKRELVHGDLRDRRTAAMPAIAAAGGMVVPALLYLLVTAGSEGARGWGIPMATDIAFAIGVVALLGPKVPAALKLFLLTLAIVDDIGAIVVIAIFYTDDLQPVFLLTAAVLLGVMLILRRAGIVWLPPYVALGCGVWLATLASGVHATIAGVVLGLLAPAQPLIAAAVAREWASDLTDEPSPSELDAMTRLAKTSVSPAERLEHLLHPWTSFLIVPLFALANAGVELRRRLRRPRGSQDRDRRRPRPRRREDPRHHRRRMAVGAHRPRPPPRKCTWPMVAGIALIAGIGFTVALFITELAFDPGALQDAAKIGVLAASTLAAVLGAAVLRQACRSAKTNNT